MIEINERTYYVKYRDADGLTWERGSLYPGYAQALSEFTLDAIKRAAASGRIKLLEVKNLNEEASQ